MGENFVLLKYTFFFLIISIKSVTDFDYIMLASNLIDVCFLLLYVF